MQTKTSMLPPATSIMPFADRKKALIILFILAFMGIFSYVLGIAMAGNGVEVFLFGVAITSMGVILLPVVLDRRFFLFEPISFVAISVLFGMTLKTFYVVLGYGSNPVVTDKLMDYMSVEDMQYGCFVVMVGLVTFVVGYSFKLRPWLAIGRLRTYRYSRTSLIVWSSIFIAISMVCFILLVLGTGFSYTGVSDLSQKRFQSDGASSATRLSDMNYYFYRIALIAKAPMYMLFYFILRYQYRWTSVYGMLFMAALFTNILVPFFISNKAGIALPLADLTIIAYIVTGRLNWKKLLLFLVGVIALISIIAAFRGGDAISHYTFFDKIFGGRYFIGVTKSAHIINAFPDQLSYFHGTTFLGWMNIFLPESLEFDNSAFAGLGFFLGYHVFDLAFSGVPPGILPEFYLNFGFWGVFVGMFVVGALLKWMHTTLFKYINYVSVLLIYTLIAVRMPTFLFNNGFTIALLKTAADVLIVMLFLWLIGSRNKGAMV